MLGGEAPIVDQGFPHIGGRERDSRLPQQDAHRSIGVEHSSGPVPHDFRPLWSSSNRPLCLQPQQHAPEILLQISDPGSRGGGRSTLQMAPRPPPLRLPSNPSPSQSHQEGNAGSSRGNSTGTLLEQAPLVRRPAVTFGSAPLADSGGSGGATAGSSRPSNTSLVPLDRLAAERGCMTALPLPSDVIEVIQASRRPSTTRIYGATWKSFSLWCRRHRVSPTSVTPEHVLCFLQEGFRSGLTPNTLRSQVAALSTVLACGSRDSLSSEPLIRQYLRGATNLRPPAIHRFPSWDLPRVLSALTGPPFEPLREVSLRLLSLKVAFLVAVTSARRVSEMTALSIRKELCIFHQDRVVLRLDPSFIPKINTVFHRTQELVLPNFCPRHHLEKRWHTLDVRRALKIYLARSSSFRRTESLFVSFLPSSLGSKITTSTLSRWIRACIATAYESQSLPVPRGITAHSTRSAATTAAWSTRASAAEICRAATWTSPTTFIRHYRLDVFASADAAFGRRVLQGVHEVSDPRVRPTPTLLDTRLWYVPY